MRILHVASEVAPLIKTGGLADVVGSLPAAQRALGHEVAVLVPGYPAVMARAGPLEPVAELGYPQFGSLTLLRGRLQGDVELLVIDHPGFFARPGSPYVESGNRDWHDNHKRFALLGRVGAQLARHGFVADLLHVHDWHAALALSYLEAEGGGRASCFTIHNLAFQGNFHWEKFRDTGLPEAMYHFRALEYHAGWSFMKSGLVYADAITTVSPTYAREILTPEAGMGLDGLLNHRRDVLHGILNGVDYSVWDPALDAGLPHAYSADKLAGKAGNKAALQRECGLADDPDALLVGVVSRLTAQKGLDFALPALAGEIERGRLQLALIGTGEPGLEAGFIELARRYPEHCAVNIGYDEAAAHRLFGGADAILVPSRFEPCGLTQLYGLRYGTLPIVRATGGLADTVRGFTGNNADKATGFRFNAPSALALTRMLGRALDVFADRETWGRLMQNAMAQDFSWERSARRYLDLYHGLVAR